MNIYFGQNLKKLRKERDLTQENIADFLGVSFQSVSKWERGESYPDITMLPVIASFFKVSVDELLGVNEAENEEKIQKYLYDAGCLTDHKAAYEIMKKAVAEFPGDFRLLDLYMRKLIASKDTPQEELSILPEVRTIYDNIQANCTADSIRVSSKRCLVSYYTTLTRIENSGITVSDVKNIIADMPLMRDSRDYAETCLFPYLNDPNDKAEHYTACRDTMDELLGLLDNTVLHYCLWEKEFSTEFKIEAIEMLLTVQNLFYSDGNFGKSWRFVMYNYGHLGELYFKLGNTEKVLENLRKSAELAKQFDELPQISERHSLLFEGSTFDKNVLGSTHIASSRMKMLMTERYPLSDEFKASKEFKEIIEMLG